MGRVRLSSIASTAVVLFLSAPAIAASNPWLGTWHLKLKKAVQKPETLIYSDAGGGATRMVSVEDGSVVISFPLVRRWVR